MIVLKGLLNEIDSDIIIYKTCKVQVLIKSLLFYNNKIFLVISIISRYSFFFTHS